MSTLNRAFKGVFIPRELYLSTDLSWTEKILLVEIDSLDKTLEGGEACFASNAHLGRFLDKSEQTIANMIVNLKKDGYLEQTGFDGRRRFLRVTEKSKAGLPETVSQGYQKEEHSNTSSNNSKLETEKASSPIDVLLKENERLFRHMPKTVRGKKVSYEEALQLEIIMHKFNYVRGLFTETESKVNPNEKACRQAIELLRDGITLTVIEEVAFNMFENKYHKENQWQHLTPEFLTRSDKFQKYAA